MNKDKIKKLAKLTVENKNVSSELAKYVLTKLSRKELIIYLRYLKTLVDRNTVRVITNSEVSPNLKKLLGNRFSDKNLVYEQDKSIGAGIKVIMNDTMLDLTLDGYLNQTITALKN